MTAPALGLAQPFGDTPDERDLRSAVRSAMDAMQPTAAVRRLTENELGFEPDDWQVLATQIGLAGLLVDPQFGGAGASLRTAGVVLEEFGRALYNGPFLSSAVAAALVLRQCDLDSATVSTAVARGEVAAVVNLPSGEPTQWRAPITATPFEDGWVLDGSSARVLHGLDAAHLLVVARAASDGWGVWHVSGSQARGHVARAQLAMDISRRYSIHTFTATPATELMTLGSTAAVRRAASLASIALAAEQIGAARYLFETTTAHLRTRYQFGRAVGSFQALKHRCVDMYAMVEGGRSVLRAALAGAQTADDTELFRLAAIAGSHCSETFRTVAEQSLQMHGGLGMAWEHDVHLYLRRAKDSEFLFGSPRSHRQSLIDVIAAR